jgi:hypothetical protein
MATYVTHFGVSRGTTGHSATTFTGVARHPTIGPTPPASVRELGFSPGVSPADTHARRARLQSADGGAATDAAEEHQREQGHH